MEKESGKNIKREDGKEKKPMTKVTNDKKKKSRKGNYNDEDLLPTINTWISTVDNFFHVSLD